MEARTFTSADGVRKIVASITAYDKKSGVVSITRKDGKSFNSKLSSFSVEDQAYTLKWLEGATENYLYVGKEYPGHLQIFLQILNSGGVGYGQTVLYQPGLPPVAIGTGPTPFLAWVDGYDKLGRAYSRFNATRINFDLIENNWRASISFQASRSVTQNTGTVLIPSGNLYGMPSVGGPILYQQPQRIVVLGKNQNPNSMIVLPRRSGSGVRQSLYWRNEHEWSRGNKWRIFGDYPHTFARNGNLDPNKSVTWFLIIQCEL
jgi:hypothetical protein